MHLANSTRRVCRMAAAAVASMSGELLPPVLADARRACSREQAHSNLTIAMPSSPLTPLALDDPTAAMLCLRLLPPRTWWRCFAAEITAKLRALSPAWCRLLACEAAGARNSSSSASCRLGGLCAALLEESGPLTTANEEIDFAGCVYTAVHHGCAGPLASLLRPLASPFGWARRSFAVAVAREALLQAALAGDAASVRAVLALQGPESPAAVWRRSLTRDDAARALEAVADWEASTPGWVSSDCREACRAALQAVC